MPAHAVADNTDNHLCLDTGFGFYGVSDHVHINDTTGTYHISTFGQASAWGYYGSGTYCYQSSTTMPCPSYVYADVYENGAYIGSTPEVGNSSVHSVNTGTYSFGTATATYLVESFVIADFGNSCTSEAFGAVSTNETT